MKKRCLEQDSPSEDLTPSKRIILSQTEESSLAISLEQLPEELIVHILGYLDLPSLSRIAQTCSLLNRLSKLDTFWNRFAKNKQDYIEKFKVIKYSREQGLVRNVDLATLHFDYSETLQPAGETPVLSRTRPMIDLFFIPFENVTFKIESFVQMHQRYIDWDEVASLFLLEESFIRMFHQKLDLRRVTRTQQLPESFIRDFRDQLDWTLVCQYQQLSEAFIREFSEFVVWEIVAQKYALPDDLLRQYSQKISSKLRRAVD